MVDTLIRCISPTELSVFLDLVGPIWERLSEKAIIVHSNAGDVLWTKTEDGLFWCHGEHDKPLGQDASLTPKT